MIIVTGGAGFIGSVLVHRLNSEGIKDIIIVDSLGQGVGVEGKWRNLLGKSFHDIIPKHSLMEFMKQQRHQIQSVIHLGACSSTQEMDMDFLLSNNVNYSKSIIQFCAEADIRCIYASSAATYGIGDQGFADDEAALDTLRPINPYGYSKHLVDLWARDSGLLSTAVGLKFFNVYGPNEYHKKSMRSRVLTAFPEVTATGVFKLFRSTTAEYPDGGQMRDFIYIDDCINAIWWFLNNRKLSGIFNVGTGSARSWNDLALAMFSALKLEPNISYFDMPPSLVAGYQNFTEATVQKLRATGFTVPTVSLEDGIADYVQNYLQKQLRTR
jgi:ADP-L-glycero-D-manno-heptose 6-epimerase